MIRVVVDTNVLVSALIKAHGAEAGVAGAIAGGRIQLCVSEPILAEYRRVLSHPKFRALDPAQVQSLLLLFEAVSVKVEPIYRLSVSPDEPDNRFLECAEEATADYLITGNKRHFPGRWKKTWILNASEFLRSGIPR